MPAYAKPPDIVRPRERASALAAVVLVQLALGLALLRGFHVDVTRAGDVVQRLIAVTLRQAAASTASQLQPPPRPKQHQAAAPKAAPDKLGGSPGPQPAHAPPSVTPIVAVRPTAAPSGGGTGTGPALGRARAAGPAATAMAPDDGGSDLEQIAGEITSRDYPRDLRDAGIGGRRRRSCSRSTQTAASAAAR